MELTVQHLGKGAFAVGARHHRLVCDQPATNGGTDSGMTPPELMLASLAACAGYYAAQYLNARKLSSENLNVRVTAEKAQGPSRLGAFRIEVDAPEAPVEHEAGLLRAVKACLIHNTLLHPPVIETQVRTGVASAA